MIAPRTASDERTESLRKQVDEFFRPGGRMEQAGAAEGFPFEVRPQQRQMALAVADAMENTRHLAVEAGTGVGKSFAYLVPLILAAKQRDVQVVVSTYTIGLQEQLIQKDIPFLQRHLGVDFKAVLVKGRGNYLCLRRLARAERMGGDLLRPGQDAELERLRKWSRETTDGTLQELQEQPSHEVWNAVNVEHGNCMGHKCPEYAPCFLFKARREIATADLLVVNHHLFFSDLALRRQKAAILPETAIAVMDEAHMMEAVASDHLGLRLSQYQFEHWLRRLYVPDANKGLLALLKHGEGAHAAVQVYEEVNRFFADVRDWAGFGREKKQQVAHAPIPVESALPAMIKRLNGFVRLVHDDQKDMDIRGELAAARRRGEEILLSLEAFMEQTMGDSVYWVASEGQRRVQTVLYSAPIEVAPLLKDSLFTSLDCVVMTSATLAVEGRLDYFVQRVGASDCDLEQVGSPFDYVRQMKILIPKGMPDPNQAEPYAEATARAVRHFVRLTKGRAFVLFTSDRLMKTVAERVRRDFVEQEFELLVQGEGLPRTGMLDRFRKGRRCVLFGLDSFWMGVDVRGEALSNVIITKLPFAVPDEPVVKARMDRIAEQGGDPFREYSLPEAILKFRQGVGRLIRSATDEGIVVILDPRITSKWYGRQFLASLPECPVERVEV
ncbi:MAG TPA: helicase C-terminal domain-containing protein [Kiritimatiellia bacterium]|nr:helicase C-terminal domain-containing protein [Kiritimatiellia bacterium]